MKKLHYEEFESLDNREKSSFMCYNIIVVSNGRASLMDCLTWLRNIL